MLVLIFGYAFAAASKFVLCIQVVRLWDCFSLVSFYIHLIWCDHRSEIPHIVVMEIDLLEIYSVIPKCH